MFSRWQILQTFKNEMFTWLDEYRMYSNKAIIFDIDETCIHIDQTRKWYRDDEIYDIYKYALIHNFYIFFITARPYIPRNQQFTMNQLKSFGFDSYNGLFLMPNFKVVNTQAIAYFKTYVRNFISINFQMIIALNIGNSWHDVLNADEMFECDCTTLKDFTIAFQKTSEACLHLKLPNHKQKNNNVIIKQ
jgi:predicted secreted acid phosphatase